MAFLTTVSNPFDPINSRIITAIDTGKPIFEVIAGFYCYHDVVVSINGQITDNYEYIIQEDDNIGFVAIPSGSGGGRKVLMAVAMIALTVVTAGWGAAGAAGSYGGLASSVGITSTFGVAAFNAGVMMVGGMLINSILAPSIPTSTGNQSIDSSSTYGWGETQNQAQEGMALPIIYGKTKITPPIISQYVETVGTKQYLNILYALNDGEITSVSDIYINDNPITYYNDVTSEIRLGINSQTIIPSFDNTRLDIGVGAKLSTTETIRQTEYNNVQGLSISVSAPSGLYSANDAGGLDSITVPLTIKYREVGGSTWYTVPNTSISGASTSTIRATFPIDGIPTFQYEISIIRTTVESTSARTQDKVYFEGFTEIVYDDFSYPTTALLAIRALATDQLSGSMPKVTCVVDRGFNTSNPSIVVQNILSLVGADINQGLFDTWTAWCISENFKCNIVFDTEMNVRDVLNIVGMLGRANIIQMGSTYMPIIERAESLPIQRFLFTMGNIIRDSFKEEYLPLADRSNVVEVTYFDETLNYERQAVELYQHGYDESTDTTRKASVSLYGCTSREQAVRHGRFIMHKNRYLTNTVSFEADIDAIACTIGDIIDVSHDVPQWGYSGRVLKVGNYQFCENFNNGTITWTSNTGNTINILGGGYSGLSALFTSTNTSPTPGGATGASYINIGAYAESLFSGKNITVELKAKKPSVSASNEFAVTYSTNEVGNSGWIRFSPTVEWKTFSFTLNVAQKVAGNGDYLGIWGDTSGAGNGVLIDDVKIYITGSGFVDSDYWYDNSAIVDSKIASISSTLPVKIDRELVLEAGIEYGFAMRLHDDTKVTISIKSTYDITTDIIPIPNTLAVSKFDIYAFGQSNRVTKLFRVISISRSSDQRRKISAIEYIPEVYNDAIDNVDIPNISSLSTVSYLNVNTDTEIDTSGKTINIINLSWNGQAVVWDIYQREAYTTTWKLIGNTQNTYFQLKDVMTGGYEFKVGDKIASTSLSQTITPLANVTNVVSYYQNGVMNIKWDAVIEQYRSPIQYEVRRGVSWANSEVLGIVGVNYLQVDKAGSYWVKAYFLGGDGVAAYSTIEAGITITGDTLVKNVVATWDEYATGWTGTKTSVAVNSGNLVMSAGTLSGSYEIPVSHIVALSSPQLCRVSITYSAGGGTSALFDSISDIDTYPNIDGDTTGKWAVKAKIAISQDGTTYGAWQDYAIGDYVGKKFKAKLDITSLDSTLTVLADGFKFTVDMPDRIDKGTITTATGGTAITFVTPFQAVPNNQITIVNATAGDDVKLTLETTGGFTVQVLNGGVGVARTINYLSQGY